MKADQDIPDAIQKKYFDLHAEIKAISGFSPMQMYNPKTLTSVYKAELRLKSFFYIFLWAGFVFLIACLLTGFYTLYFESQTFNGQTNIEDKKTIRMLRHNFSGLLSILFGLISSLSFYGLYRNRMDVPTDGSARLMKDALRPRCARLTYKVFSNILDQKIPVGTLYHGLVHDFPIYNFFGKYRRNALLFLMGNDQHRKALMKEGSLSSGPRFIDRKYYDEIFGDYKTAIIKMHNDTRNSRDKRFLKTALMYEQHMQNSILEFKSDAFWQDGNLRKSHERKIFMELSVYLSQNWEPWKEFRSNLKNLNYILKDKNHEHHHFASKLLSLCQIAKPVDIKVKFLRNFLAGELLSAARFFIRLNAIEEPDLVSKSQIIK